MGAPVSLKQATKASFGGKKTLKIYIFSFLQVLGYFSKTKTEHATKKIKSIW